jgi:hypothetical protein
VNYTLHRITSIGTTIVSTMLRCHSFSPTFFKAQSSSNQMLKHFCYEYTVCAAKCVEKALNRNFLCIKNERFSNFRWNSVQQKSWSAISFYYELQSLPIMHFSSEKRPSKKGWDLKGLVWRKLSYVFFAGWGCYTEYFTVCRRSELLRNKSIERDHFITH